MPTPSRSVSYEIANNLSVVSPASVPSASSENASHQAPVQVFEGHENPVYCISFYPDESKLVSGSSDGTLCVWDRKMGAVQVLSGHTDRVCDVDVSWDGKMIVSGSMDKTVRIWDGESGETMRVFEGHEHWVRSVEFSRDSSRVVSGSDDGIVQVWSVETGELAFEPIKCCVDVYCVRYSPSGDRIASGGHSVHVWDAETGSGILSIRNSFKGITSLVWTADGTHLIGVGGRIVTIWSSRNGEQLRVWKAHDHISFISTLSLSPTSAHLVTSNWGENTAFVFDISTGEQVAVFNHDGSTSYGVAYSSSGSFIATGCKDTKVYVWAAPVFEGPHTKAQKYDQRASPPPEPVFNRVYGTFTNLLTRGSVDATQTNPVKELVERVPQPQQVFNTTQPAQQKVVSSVVAPSSQPPPAPPTSIDEGEGSDPRLSALVTGDSNANAGTAWNLNDIWSKFAHDLTGHIARESEHASARGSFGDIYRGTLSMGATSIHVAVKVIRTYSADDGDDAKKNKRLRRELKTWLNLDHLNVLPLFGTTNDFGPFPAMVCPWLDNGSLSSYLQRRDDNLTLVERLALVGDVAAGLQYLHSQSVVHGDLSDANVLIHRSGRAYISDFGLSTLLTELGGSTYATSRQAAGTLRWTALELIDLGGPEDEGDPVHIIPSPQSDVYSFGRIMLEVLTGAVPYHYYVRDVQVLYAISKGMAPRRPSEAQVTDRQWTFMQRCWTPVGAGGSESRPSNDEIVEFVRQELLDKEEA